MQEIKGIDQFKTDKVTNMKAMFNECNELTDLNLSNFDSSKVTDMSFMFNNCNKLRSLDLSNFTIHGESQNIFNFKGKEKCKFTTNSQELLKLYNSY